MAAKAEIHRTHYRNLLLVSDTLGAKKVENADHAFGCSLAVPRHFWSSWLRELPLRRLLLYLGIAPAERSTLESVSQKSDGAYRGYPQQVCRVLRKM